ncbi:dipeptidase [Humitalea sp. 24SJ18S-53]|uniref:dipeptidase n=1 Tax=Humitalea sp. 24SJ18S-53 TaxID=3422307 RepID=UPI003D66B6DB
MTLVLDTHVDFPWPTTPDPAGDTTRQVDFPKMTRGGMGAVVLIAYVAQGKRDAESRAAARARADGMLARIAADAQNPVGPARRFCRTADEMEAAHAAGALAILAGVENGHAMGGELAALAAFRDAGAIYMTLTHDGHNDLADAARPRPTLGDGPEEHGGLSDFGRAAIVEMNRVGLLVDVSHASKPAMLQAAKLSRTPVVATHTACRALVDHPRNLDDEQLDALRAVGGLCQITAVGAFLRAGAEASMVDYLDHVEHSVRRIGIDHTGLSSDFDGGGGFIGWKDASQTAAVTAGLATRGFSAREIGLLWSGNFLRVMRAVEKAAL